MEGRIEPGIVSFNPHQTTWEQGRKEFKLSGKFLVVLFIIVSTRVGEKTCLKFFGISINGRGKGIIRSNNGTRIFLEPWNPRLSNWSIELHPPRDWTERSPFYWKKSDDLVVLTFFFFLFFFRFEPLATDVAKGFEYTQCFVETYNLKDIKKKKKREREERKKREL